MGLFEKKKKLTEEEIIKKERDDLIKRIMDEKKNESELNYSMPEKYEFNKTGKRRIDLGSQEYKLYQEEEKYSKEPHTAYEKFCYYSGKILRLPPDDDTKTKLQNAINFSGMHSTPEDVTGASVVAALLSFLLLVFTFFLPVGTIILKLILILFVPLLVAYFMLTYPFNYANTVRIREGRELITALLYIVVYLRSTPNLENAVRFAAKNVTGKLKWDLKRVFWKVEVGIHNSIEDALMEYLKGWKNYNKEFLEGMHLIRESMLESDEVRRTSMLDKAINVVLDGMDEKMKMYARNLETPIMVLHGLGILLPVMGMIVFPLLSIFLASDSPNIPLYLFLGYDIFLPLVVYIFIRQILGTRPSTHSSVEVALNKSMEIERGFSIRNMLNMKRIILLFSIVGGMIFLVPGLKYLIATNMFQNCAPGEMFAACADDDTTLVHTMGTMMMSLLVVVGLAVIFVIYHKGKCYKTLEVRERVSSIEEEFEQAMFALGNRLVSGIPIEFALEKAIEDTQELSISKLFEVSLKNMNRLSMSFEDSLFDPKYGALNEYPSPLIHTIMRSIAGTLERGSKYGAVTMLTIAKYLRTLRVTQEKINDLLSSTVSSMKFQAYVLVPAISGVVIAVSDLIIKMLTGLSSTFENLTRNMPGEASGLSPLSIINVKESMPAELLQIVVGVYVVQILVLLAIFVNRIEVGVDEIRESDTIWKFVTIGTVSYIVILIIIMMVFSPLLGIANMSGMS
ncbi:MAG: hypothetical protein ABIG84_02050 [archaeon]